MDTPTVQANPWEPGTVGLFSSPLRALKTIILIPVVLLRIAGALVCLVFAFIFVMLAICVGCVPKPDPNPADVNPVPMPCRFWVFMTPCKYLGRGLLFFLGYQWISWEGRPATKSEAPLVCPNHTSWVDTFYMTSALLCTGMSRHDNYDQPVVGSFLRALQFVLVDRNDPTSNGRAAKVMEARINAPSFPQFLIFPEGEVNNGKYLCQFKDGPFRWGLPVQPVHLSYPYEKWGSGYDPMFNVIRYDQITFHVLRALFEFHNPLHVTWLPVYHPSEEERKDSILYANNVREYMSKETGVPITDYTQDDVRMMDFARRKLKVEDEFWSLVEMGKAREELGFKLDDAKKILQRFENVDTDGSGKTDLKQFLDALGLPRTPLTERVFKLYDLDGDGVINFREYLCAQAMLRGINAGSGHAPEHTVAGSPLHPESLDFAWQVFLGSTAGKNTIEFADVAKFFQRYGLPSIEGTRMQQLFNQAKGDKPAMDRAAFDTFMSSTPEYMQLLRLGEMESSAKA